MVISIFHKTFTKSPNVFKTLSLLSKIKNKLLSSQTSDILNIEKVIQLIIENSKLDYQGARELYFKACDELFSKSENLFYSLPDTPSFLKELSSTYNIYLPTNPIWPKKYVLKRLDFGNIQNDLFIELTHSENMKSCKPNLSYYKTVLDLWEIDPKESIMVGNSMKKDGPAAQCGLKTFIIKGKTDHGIQGIESLLELKKYL